MTPSRVAWFLGTLVLITPILLAAFSGGDEVTGPVILESLAWATGIAMVQALLWGKARRREDDA